MSVRRHLRDAIELARTLGVTDARIEQRGKHPHLVGRTPVGTVLRYVLPNTPSDGVHGAKNTLADLRRACRGGTAAEPRQAGGPPRRRRARRAPRPAAPRSQAACAIPGGHRRPRETPSCPFATPAMAALKERLEGRAVAREEAMTFRKPPPARYRRTRHLRWVRRPSVRIIVPSGQTSDEVQQHMARWRKQLAFDIAQHPNLVAKAKKIGIVLDIDDPEPSAGNH